MRRQPDRLEANPLSGAIVPERPRVGAGKSLEEIIEAAILLDDDDDVLDLAARVTADVA
jgi:hypothetical protein